MGMAAAGFEPLGPASALARIHADGPPWSQRNKRHGSRYLYVDVPGRRGCARPPMDRVTFQSATRPAHAPVHAGSLTMASSLGVFTPANSLGTASSASPLSTLAHHCRGSAGDVSARNGTYS